jgi:hypothetical protein
MYIVRTTFTARPGMASKLARLLKDVMTESLHAKVRVMTDYVGPMNTIVADMEVNELADFEKSLKEYTERTDVRERMQGYTDLYLTGLREIYRVV